MKEKHADKAKQLFLQGYNCAQAVVCAFDDLTGLDRETAARLASSFGGGMGRMREVCGTVSGALLVLGLARAADPYLPRRPRRPFTTPRCGSLPAGSGRKAAASSAGSCCKASRPPPGLTPSRARRNITPGGPAPIWPGRPLTFWMKCSAKWKRRKNHRDPSHRTVQNQG